LAPLLHLTLAARDFACVQHMSGGHGHRAAASAAGAHHDGHAEAGRAHSQSCETLPPDRPDCCSAMVGCGVSVSAIPGIALRVFVDAFSSIASPKVDAPTSIAASPDPPPPKA
jgi:hypothetical protein